MKRLVRSPSLLPWSFWVANFQKHRPHLSFPQDWGTKGAGEGGAARGASGGGRGPEGHVINAATPAAPCAAGVAEKPLSPQPLSFVTGSHLPGRRLAPPPDDGGS